MQCGPLLSDQGECIRTPDSPVKETTVANVQVNEDGVPSQVNGYRVTTYLGDGTFSKVYLCEDSDGQEYVRPAPRTTRCTQVLTVDAVIDTGAQDSKQIVPQAEARIQKSRWENGVVECLPENRERSRDHEETLPPQLGRITRSTYGAGACAAGSVINYRFCRVGH
jgi:hypothetical protein